MIGFLARVAFGTAAFTVRHVVVPIAMSVAAAVVFAELTERVRVKDSPVIDPDLNPAP